jgi:hypothetical protein
VSPRLTPHPRPLRRAAPAAPAAPGPRAPSPDEIPDQLAADAIAEERPAVRALRIRGRASGLQRHDQREDREGAVANADSDVFAARRPGLTGRG